MLKFGFPLIFASILSWVNSVSDRFFLLHYQDLSQIGLYSIASTFSQPILLVNAALTMAFGILLMSLYSEEKDDNKPKTKSFLTKIWYTYLAVGISIGSVISIFSYDLVNFITTPSYVGGILAIPFLLFSHLLFMSSEITGNGMTLKEQSKPYFWILLAAAGTNFGLNFYFVPNFGFVGAAITTIISNIIYFLVGYFWSQKVFFIKRSLIKPVLYFSIGLSVSIFFPFYEYNLGTHTSYIFKISALIIVLTLPFIFKFIDIGTVMSLINNVKQKIKG
jgi:O-antigen/teichoic acid export membrane protein